MTIIERKTVREAVARAMLQHPADTGEAIEKAAQALCLPAEAVREVIEPTEGDPA